MFDEWSNFSVHVALDNTVVIEDISMFIILIYFIKHAVFICLFIGFYLMPLDT